MPTTQALTEHDNKLDCTSEIDIAVPATDALGEELTRLASINAELVGRLRGASPAVYARPAHPVDSADEVAGLRRENAELRARVEVLEQLLVAQADEDSWAERQREYEALLDEKSEVIRGLHLKLQELQEGPRRAPDEPIPREEQLLQMKHELEGQRRQLEEDEESLMAQMRQMELALSKDRAELARQRQEVQRLQTDLNREIEQADKNPELRERLHSLRRVHEPTKREPASPQADAKAADGAKSSGLFRRLFGNGK
jgi:chromosome segregation ATPase